MATPQWVLLQRRIEPSRKIPETQYERNSKKRQIEEVRTAVKRGFLKHLDHNLILESISEPGVQELDHVTYISLPYYSIQSINELSMLSCPRLTIANLPSNFITDLSVFCSCVNLLKLDLSGNRIQVLPEHSFWSSLQSLKILYLNNNIISDKDVLLHLSHCSSLQILTMYDNPVALLTNYRHITVNCILSLKALDHHVISDQEIIENIQLAGKFRARAKPFHRLLYLPVDKENTLKDELREIYQLLLSVDTVLAHHSPVLIIQRWVRGWLTRNRILKSDNSNLKALIRHRQKSSNRIQKFIKGTAMHILPQTWSDGGRIGTADHPLPPPSSPIPSTPYGMKHLPTATTTDSTGNPDDIELQRTIKETKKILSEGNSHETKKFKPRNTHAKKCKKEISKPPLIKDNDENSELAIQGEHQEVTEINKLDYVKDMKMKDAQEIREAENDIKELMLKTRKSVELQTRASCWPKDSHAFIRGHATMSLAMLKELNRKQHIEQKGNDLTKKAKIVAKVKEDRELKKKRIFQNKQNLKDAIIAWKLGEEKLLREKKALMELEEEAKRIKKAENIESMVEVMKNRREKEKLALIFTQQHNMMDKRLHKAERKLQKVYMEDIYKDKVQSSRLSAQEQAEVVNKFMELRQEKMRSENNEEKEKMNSLMIELASQRMMETKQKVAKVKAWKKVARSLRTMEEDDLLCSSNVPTNDLSIAFDSIPEADTVDVGILGPLLQAYANIGLNSTPLNMRGITNQSHRTWQRGCIEIMKHTRDNTDVTTNNTGNCHFDHHLPRLKPVSDLQPLMYDQLPPPPFFHHIGTTPDNTYQTNTPVLEVGGIIENSLSFPEPLTETLHPLTPAQSGRPFTFNIDHHQ